MTARRLKVFTILAVNLHLKLNKSSQCNNSGKYPLSWWKFPKQSLKRVEMFEICIFFLILEVVAFAIFLRFPLKFARTNWVLTAFVALRRFIII